MRHRIDGTAFFVRSPTPDDVDALLTIKNNRAAADLLAGTPREWTRQELLDWVVRHAEAPDEAFFLVVDGADRPVGHAALYRIDRDAGTAEFGILLGDATVWGRGLGTATTRQLIEHGFQVLGLRRIYLEVLETNVRARRVYEKIGFQAEGRLRQHQVRTGVPVDVLLMGLLREEYARPSPTDGA